PESKDREGNCDVSENAPVSDQVKIAGSVLEVRLDQPEHIDEPRPDHEDAKPDHPPLGALEVTRKKNAERDHPVADHVERANRPPSTTDPVQIPRNFVRHVSGVDDQELREGEID